MERKNNRFEKDENFLVIIEIKKLNCSSLLWELFFIRDLYRDLFFFTNDSAHSGTTKRPDLYETKKKLQCGYMGARFGILLNDFRTNCCLNKVHFRSSSRKHTQSVLLFLCLVFKNSLCASEIIYKILSRICKILYLRWYDDHQKMVIKKIFMLVSSRCSHLYYDF